MKALIQGTIKVVQLEPDVRASQAPVWRIELRQVEGRLPSQRAATFRRTILDGINNARRRLEPQYGRAKGRCTNLGQISGSIMHRHTIANPGQVR